MTWGQALPLMAVIVLTTVCLGALVVVSAVIKNAASHARDMVTAERRQAQTLPPREGTGRFS